jgi:hypothetical protein
MIAAILFDGLPVSGAIWFMQAPKPNWFFRRRIQVSGALLRQGRYGEADHD